MQYLPYIRDKLSDIFLTLLPHERLFSYFFVCQHTPKGAALTVLKPAGWRGKGKESSRTKEKAGRMGRIWDPVIERCERRFSVHYRLAEAAGLYIKKHIYTRNSATLEETTEITDLVYEACRSEKEFFETARADFEKLKSNPETVGAESMRVKDILEPGIESNLIVKQSPTEFARKVVAEIAECVRHAAAIRTVMESIGDTARWRARYTVSASDEEKKVIGNAKETAALYWGALTDISNEVREFIDSLPDGELKTKAAEAAALLHR